MTSPLAKWTELDLSAQTVKCKSCIYITDQSARKLGDQPGRALIRRGSSRPAVVGVGSRDGHGDAAHADPALLRRLGFPAEQDYAKAKIKRARWFEVVAYSGSALLSTAIAVLAPLAAVATGVTAFLSSTSGLTISVVALALTVLVAFVKAITEFRTVSSIDC